MKPPALLDEQQGVTIDSLEKLFYLTGVATDYHDYAGRYHEFSRDLRARVLRAAGYALDDESVQQTIFRLDAEPWIRPLRSFAVTREQQPLFVFQCHPAQLGGQCQWRIGGEDGRQLSGEFVPGHCPESGNYIIDDVRYSARDVALPPLPPGYHKLSVTTPYGDSHATLAVCPERCYDPLAEHDRLWGINCQLYTLRSGHNWGIGDFGDLMTLVDHAAASGADMIGLNPLHALCGDSPDAASPYSPSDRRFINPLYIAPHLAGEYADNPGLETLLADASFHARRKTLQAGSQVDYDGVNALKYEVYDQLYQVFRDRHLLHASPRAEAFLAFAEERGGSLEAFSRYETEHNPHSRAFGDDPFYHKYLQWLAVEQLCACQQRALTRGMRLGLVGDLAVASVSQGCEVQTHPSLFAAEVNIGAPPDDFAPQGQNWGMPVIDPVAMRHENFRHYIELLRASMTCCGALRIDHAMALMRLWWCLPAEGAEPAAGVYVHYPLQELLALLCLESHRHRCLVVAEDMGVVPPAFRHAMVEHGLYGNRLLYFEKHPDGRFKQPAEQQEDVLLMVTNHDVPTLADWWHSGDLMRRHRLGLIAGGEPLDAALRERDHNRAALLHRLSESDLLPPGWTADSLDRDFDLPLCQAIHRLCGRSRARLMMLQLEDLQLMDTPVNIPGTCREYANWRRKQWLDIGQLFASDKVGHLLAAVSGERQHAEPA